MTTHDVIIIGAGAAGLMCAIEAGKRGRRVLLLDHAEKPGEKIRISGGGRCNFTNLHCSAKNFLSENPHFCVSALKRYTQHDFIKLVQKHNIKYHEKTLGQLFCDESSQQIIDMLMAECAAANVQVSIAQKVTQLAKTADGFSMLSNGNPLTAKSVVIASGGISIPKMGASGFGYDIAKQFGINVIEPRAALVPLTFEKEMLEYTNSLSGLAVDVAVTCNKMTFKEAMLFTHRGLSGPAILQISSYWKEGDSINIDLSPTLDVFKALKGARIQYAKQDIGTVLSYMLPKRLAQSVVETNSLEGIKIGDMSDKKFQALSDALAKWSVTPSGSEGFRTAEVTLGGVDTKALSSKTFESNTVPGLYFIGEVVDVTGHLGGFNFQWAWSSGHAAGQYA